MLRILKNKKAQAVTGEYILIFFLAFAAISTMTMYFRRAIQGRIFGAKDYMGRTVAERAGELVPGIQLTVSYEPYYLNVASQVRRDATVESNLLPGGTGTFIKNIGESTTVESDSVTAPPMEAQ